MLQLLELLPLAVFVFIYGMKGKTVDVADLHYSFDGIYSATAALMIATTLQVLLVWLLKRNVEKRLLVLFAIVIVFGSATLLLHNPLFLFWKPTVFNWGLCLLLLGSHWFSNDNMVEKMLGDQLPLPSAIYARLSFVWAAYFFLVGALNLVIAFNFPEAFWVKYKLWSSIGYTVVMMVITGIMLAPHIQNEPGADTEK